MKTLEDSLKEYILNNYKNLTVFCNKIGMPWTTLDSIFKRGIKKSSIVNVLKITHELGIDTESLLDDKIVLRSEAVTVDIPHDDRKILVDYHALDEYGQIAVLETLDREKRRCLAQDREKEGAIS